MPATRPGSATTQRNANLYRRASTVALVLDSKAARVAYGFRKLRTAYAGFCCRVVNSAGTSFEIGFNASGFVNETDLVSASIGGDLTMSMWYDQSGNALNLYPDSVSRAPRLVQAGVVNKINGRVAWHSVTDRYLRSSNFSLLTQNYMSAHYVGLAQTGVLHNSPYSKTTGGYPNFVDWYDGTYLLGNGSSHTNNALISGYIPASGVSLFNNIHNGTVTSATRNGVNNYATPTITTNVMADSLNEALYLGTRSGLGTAMAGFCGEAIFFSDILTAGEVTSINSNIMQYFAIT